MRGERATGDSLAAGPCSLATPGAGDRKREGELPRATGAEAGGHLDWATIIQLGVCLTDGLRGGTRCCVGFGENGPESVESIALQQ
jgi:hypothetical protein